MAASLTTKNQFDVSASGSADPSARPSPSVTDASAFPARQYSVNGERRSFALLRPTVNASSQHGLRDIILEILEAYKEHEAELAAIA